jgi:hypothetical protein
MGGGFPGGARAAGRAGVFPRSWFGRVWQRSWRRTVPRHPRCPLCRPCLRRPGGQRIPTPTCHQRYHRLHPNRQARRISPSQRRCRDRLSRFLAAVRSSRRSPRRDPLVPRRASRRHPANCPVQGPCPSRRRGSTWRRHPASRRHRPAWSHPRPTRLARRRPPLLRRPPQRALPRLPASLRYLRLGCRPRRRQA